MPLMIVKIIAIVLIAMWFVSAVMGFLALWLAIKALRSINRDNCGTCPKCGARINKNQ